MSDGQTQKGGASVRRAIWRTEKGIHLLHEADNWAPALCQAVHREGNDKQNQFGSCLAELSTCWRRQALLK